ncbi:MAG TPA: hypothetical protein VFA27_06415 [Vicinamibacterales bacterium]|nr:hypothetical protein [Vicinamibacterales bacterium]
MARQLPSVPITPAGAGPLLFLLSVQIVLYLRDRIRAWIGAV